MTIYGFYDNGQWGDQEGDEGYCSVWLAALLLPVMALLVGRVYKAVAA